ncbi:MAG: hypothetical protein QNJ53_26325 [Pleurocapsa sp. MO_192.B19]|nr:hypothetical protein [Pleurocapsa sp. MO_192.B19]
MDLTVPAMVELIGVKAIARDQKAISNRLRLAIAIRLVRLNFRELV